MNFLQELDYITHTLDIVEDYIANFNYKDALNLLLKLQTNKLNYIPDDDYVKISARFYYDFAIVYYYMRNYTEAFKIFLQLHENLSVNGNKSKMFCSTSVYIGWLQIYLANYDVALAYLTHGITLAEDLDDVISVVRGYSGLSIINLWKGEVSEARRLIDKANQYLDRIKDNPNQLIKLYNINGIVNWKQGYGKEAKQWFKRARDLDGNIYPLNQGITLFYLFIIADYENDVKEINKIYTTIKQLALISQDKLLLQGITFIEGIYDMRNPRYHIKFRAYDKFISIINDEIIYYTLVIQAMQKLCELLIIEYQASENPVVRDEIELRINQILKIADKQQSYSLLVEMNILKAKFLMVTYEMDESLKIMDEMIKLTENKNLGELHKLVIKSRDEIENYIDKWLAMENKFEPLRERLRKIKVLNYLRDIQSVLMT